MLKILLAAGLVTGLLGSSAAVDPSPSDQVVIIDVITVNGTGCPVGSASVSLPPEGGIAIDYDAFVVGIGGGRTDMRKICQFALLVHPPTGYTFALGGVRHTGSLTLASGAVATVRTLSFYSGAGAPTVQTHQFTGPSTDELSIDDLSPVVGACGATRAVNVSAELRIDPGTSDPTTTSTATLRQSMVLPVTLLPCS